MYSPPLHRRILPWVFVAVFFIVAPTLVFYTAGYRWNPKKQRVERNGTLIIDSTPGRAHVLLNGRDTGETTPITLQNVAPGSYTLRIEKNGYTSWEKRLAIMPEYVTFANTIWLWKISQPDGVAAIPLADKKTVRLSTAPNQKTIAVMSTDTQSVAVRLLSNDDTVESTFSFPATTSTHVSGTWSSDSRALLLEMRDASSTQNILIPSRSTRQPVLLPRASYAWQDSLLVGLTPSSTVSVRSDESTVKTTPRAVGTLDTFGDAVLQVQKNAEGPVYLENARAKRGIILPKGSWRFVTENASRIIFHDGSSWLSLDPNGETPSVGRVTGDMLRPLDARKRSTYLLIDGSELWTWNPAGNPELLTRGSAPLRAAAWHSSGGNVFFADDTTVRVIELDQRDGRRTTTLAAFDRIDDMAALDDVIYVSGVKDGALGLWRIETQ